MDRAMKLHRRFPLVDGHNDLPHAMRKGFKNKLAAVDLNQDQSCVKVAGLKHGSLHTDMVSHTHIKQLYYIFRSATHV